MPVGPFQLGLFYGSVIMWLYAIEASVAVPSLGCQGSAVAGRADVILLLSVGSLWREDSMAGCPDSAACSAPLESIFHNKGHSWLQDPLKELRKI